MEKCAVIVYNLINLDIDADFGFFAEPKRAFKNNSNTSLLFIINNHFLPCNTYGVVHRMT